MKRFYGLAVVILLLLTLGTLMVHEKYSDKTSQETTVNIKASDLSFAVLGDIHENVKSFQTAIKDLHAINPRTHALILNGDTVDQGLISQYDSLKNTIEKNKALLPPTIIKNIGNHEFFNYEIEVNSREDVKTFINRYLEFAGEEKVYHDKWLSGYHFISLGSEDGNSETLDSMRAYISKDQLDWFKNKLQEKYEKDKPIFVFLHQRLNTTSTTGWVGSDQGQEIAELLSNYPEVILFSSHTHRQLDETSVNNSDQVYTTVHTGAVHYTFVTDNQGNRTREPLIKGLYVEVRDNQVVIRGRDMKEHSWIFEKEISSSN